jgi:hypothetical protein
LLRHTGSRAARGWIPHRAYLCLIGELKTPEGVRTSTGTFGADGCARVCDRHLQQLAAARLGPSEQEGIVAAQEAAARTAGVSIAVLPFANLSGDVVPARLQRGRAQERRIFTIPAICSDAQIR